MTRSILRNFTLVFGIIAVWQAAIWIFQPPAFLFPAPLRVFETLVAQYPYFLEHTGWTLLEILLGMTVAIFLGTLLAIAMAASDRLRLWLLPLFLASQAIPVFALAPLLVLWLGYGLASKVAMAALIIYFPVTASIFHGLQRCDPAWLDMARVMVAQGRQRKWAILLKIRLPAAMPSFVSGLKMAAAVAPIGAVIGEWVGSSQGLGYITLLANARMKSADTFAGILLLTLMSILLYLLVDAVTKRLLPWATADRDSALM